MMWWHEFHFLRPWWFLALIPAKLLVVMMLRLKGARSAFSQVCDSSLLPYLLLESSRTGRRWRPVLLGISWLVAVTAIAGPVWERQPSPVYNLKQGRVIVLDLSPSMNATDLKPSRLKRAEFKIRDILKQSREGLTGLVVFGAEPFTVVPMTDDISTIETMLPALSTAIIPVKGDRARDALKLAARLLQQAGVKGGQIILITDGISDTASCISEISGLRRSGITVSVLGVGTEKGAPVPEQGGGFIRDAAGRPVVSRLNAAELRELARTGGGRFSKLTPDDSDISSLLSASMNAGLSDSAESRKGHVDRWREQGAWLVLLLIPVCLGAFRRGWLLSLVLAVMLCLPGPARAFSWKDLWQRRDQQAWELYQKGRYDEAARLFDTPGRKAAALYRAGKYEEAARLLEGQKGASDAYNRANSLAKAGKLSEALDAYRQALKLDPDDQDARFNMELVKKLLEEQQKRQQGKNGKNSGQGRKKDSEKSSDSNKEKGQSQDGEKKKDSGVSRQQQDKAGKQDSSKGGEKQAKEKGDKSTGVEKSAPQSPRPESAGRGDDNQNKSGDKNVPASSKQSDREERSEQKEKAEGHAAPVPRRQEEGNRPSEDTPVSATSENEQAWKKDQKEIELEQWLRQIPDDPSGLLRRKFYLEHQRRLRSR